MRHASASALPTTQGIIDMRIILASKSPRRRELLSGLVSDFEIITAETDEVLGRDITPRDGVVILAERKGRTVITEALYDAIVISSDTLVELDGVPLGKPSSRENAEQMLRSLSGRAHNVHTGVAVHYRGRCLSGVDTTRVIFRDMTDSEIGEYVESGEPMDKAGAYGIQGIGGKFVAGYEGRFDTVMGLPVELVRRLMNEAVGEERFTL